MLLIISKQRLRFNKNISFFISTITKIKCKIKKVFFNRTIKKHFFVFNPFVYSSLRAIS